MGKGGTAPRARQKNKMLVAYMKNSFFENSGKPAKNPFNTCAPETPIAKTEGPGPFLAWVCGFAGLATDLCDFYCQSVPRSRGGHGGRVIGREAARLHCTGSGGRDVLARHVVVDGRAGVAVGAVGVVAVRKPNAGRGLEEDVGCLGQRSGQVVSAPSAEATALATGSTAQRRKAFSFSRTAGHEQRARTRRRKGGGTGLFVPGKLSLEQLWHAILCVLQQPHAHTRTHAHTSSPAGQVVCCICVGLVKPGRSASQARAP